jgi:hypothetical protein
MIETVRVFVLDLAIYSAPNGGNSSHAGVPLRWLLRVILYFPFCEHGMLLVKVLVVILLLAVIVSLFSGLFFLVKDEGTERRITKALTWRIGLSIAAFALILIAGLSGIIPMDNTSP